MCVWLILFYNKDKNGHRFPIKERDRNRNKERQNAWHGGLHDKKAIYRQTNGFIGFSQRQMKSRSRNIRIKKCVLNFRK